MRSALLSTAISFGLVWFVPGIFVVEILNLWQSDPLFVHWTTTVDMINGSYIFLLPICAGVACAASLPTVRRWEMMSVVPDAGLRSLAWPLTAVACTFSAVHAVTVAATVGLGYAREIPGHPNIFPVLPVLVAFFTAASLGVLIARIAPSLISAPFCVVAIYLLEIFLPRMSPRPFSDFGGATSVLLGLQNRLDVMLGQIVFLGSIVPLVLMLSVYGTRLLRSPLLGLTLCAVVAGTGTMLASLGDHRFTEVAVEFTCDRTAVPAVCITREYQDELGFYAERVREIHGELEELGVSTLPEVYKQAAGADVPSGGRFTTESDSLPEQTAFEVLQSAYPCSPGWSNRDFTRAELVIGYLVVGEGGRLYPGAQRSTRDRAMESLDDLTCDD